MLKQQQNYKAAGSSGSRCSHLHIQVHMCVHMHTHTHSDWGIKKNMFYKKCDWLGEDSYCLFGTDTHVDNKGLDR